MQLRPSIRAPRINRENSNRGSKAVRWSALESELPSPPVRQSGTTAATDEPNTNAKRPSAARGAKGSSGLLLSIPGGIEEEAPDAESQPGETRESHVSFTETCVSGDI